MDLYSAFALEQDTTLTVLIFQLIKLPSRRGQYLVVDFIVEGDIA